MGGSHYHAVMLTTEIQTTSELLSIALAKETKAVDLYSELAASMRDHDNSEAATAFDRLIDEAREHQQRLAQWANLEGLEIDEAITPVDWEDPRAPTSYDVEATDPYRSTPYKAFALAAHNEERAFRYLTYVAADSQSPGVCDHAMNLARAQLDRVAAMRVLRRYAWHAQDAELAEPRVDPTVVQGVPDLLSIIVFVEQHLLRLFKLAARGFPGLDSQVSATIDSLTSSESALREGESPSAEAVLALKEVSAWIEGTNAGISDAPSAFQRLCADCDRCFVFYDSVERSTQNESVMFMAQRQSTLAMQRIKFLRSIENNGANPSAPAATS